MKLINLTEIRKTAKFFNNLIKISNLNRAIFLCFILIVASLVVGIQQDRSRKNELIEKQKLVSTQRAPTKSNVKQEEPVPKVSEVQLPTAQPSNQLNSSMQSTGRSITKEGQGLHEYTVTVCGQTQTFWFDDNEILQVGKPISSIIVAENVLGLNSGINFSTVGTAEDYKLLATPLSGGMAGQVNLFPAQGCYGAINQSGSVYFANFIFGNSLLGVEIKLNICGYVNGACQVSSASYFVTANYKDGCYPNPNNPPECSGSKMYTFTWHK